MINEQKFVHDPRRGGLVKRYHAQTHTVTQTVAEHTWQLLRIATTVWPDVPRHVMLYIQYHDVSEAAVGDMPYTVKLQRPLLKAEMDAAEQEALAQMRRMWDTPIIPILHPEEKKFVKACELVEFAEYSWNELNQGNKYIQVVLDRVLPLIEAVKLENTYINTRFHSYFKARREYEEKIHDER